MKLQSLTSQTTGQDTLSLPLTIEKKSTFKKVSGSKNGRQSRARSSSDEVWFQPGRNMADELTQLNVVKVETNTCRCRRCSRLLKNEESVERQRKEEARKWNEGWVLR
jgi:hypothetical protein